MPWTDYSAAPAPGTPVCAASAVSAVSAVTALAVVTDRGSFPLLLVRSAAGLRAYVNACPHQYLPLDYRGKQLLSADGTRLLCTAHGASFDAATGAVAQGADCGLDPVPVVEQGGTIRIAPDALAQS